MNRATETKGQAVVQAYILNQTEFGKTAAVSRVPVVTSAEDITLTCPVVHLP